MKRKRTCWILFIVAASALVVGTLIWTALGGHYVADVTVKRTFSIARPFTSLRKIMVRTDAAKQIMNAGANSTVISQEWDGHNFKLDRLSIRNPEWRIDATGNLKVRIQNHYLGSKIIDFSQNVTITPDQIDSIVNLKKPEGQLLGYKVTIEMSADGSTSLINQSLNLKIDTPAPWFAHWFARKRVRIAARKTLLAQEKHIKDAAEKHRGEF